MGYRAGCLAALRAAREASGQVAPLFRSEEAELSAKTTEIARKRAKSREIATNPCETPPAVKAGCSSDQDPVSRWLCAHWLCFWLYANTRPFE